MSIGPFVPKSRIACRIDRESYCVLSGTAGIENDCFGCDIRQRDIHSDPLISDRWFASRIVERRLFLGRPSTMIPLVCKAYTSTWRLRNLDHVTHAPIMDRPPAFVGISSILQLPVGTTTANATHGAVDKYNEPWSKGIVAKSKLRHSRPDSQLHSVLCDVPWVYSNDMRRLSMLRF